MSDRKFDLGDYVEVKDRIAKFYEMYAQGRLVTRRVEMIEVNGSPYVLVHALAYRTPDDPHPGTGTSWLEVPGKTSYTKGSEVENAETSAWGRAIGSLGILIDKGLASTQEVNNKRESDEPDRQVGTETLELLGRIQKAGKVMKGGAEHYKGDWHETPDGPVYGFKLKLEGEDRDIPQVLVNGSIATALLTGHPDLIGTRVTVKGHLYNVKQQGRTAYYRLIVGERPEDWIETTDVRIPPLPDPEQDAIDSIPVAEGQVSAFDQAESDAIDREAAEVA